MSRTAHHDSRSGARSVARKLALQAVYRLQINDGPWQDVVNEFLTAVPHAEGREGLDTRLSAWLDRKPAELDPVEHAVLLVGTWELQSRPDVPYRVVINEAVTLTRKFGATDGYKFVNAVLDRAARELRPHEH